MGKVSSQFTFPLGVFPRSRQICRSHGYGQRAKLRGTVREAKHGPPRRSPELCANSGSEGNGRSDSPVARVNATVHLFPAVSDVLDGFILTGFPGLTGRRGRADTNPSSSATKIVFRFATSQSFLPYRRLLMKSRVLFPMVAIAALFCLADARDASACGLLKRLCGGCDCCNTCCDPCADACDACEPSCEAETSCCDPCGDACDSCCDPCCDPCCRPRLLHRLGGWLRSCCKRTCCDSCCDPCADACGCESSCGCN